MIVTKIFEYCIIKIHQCATTLRIFTMPKPTRAFVYGVRNGPYPKHVVSIRTLRKNPSGCEVSPDAITEQPSCGNRRGHDLEQK